MSSGTRSRRDLLAVAALPDTCLARIGALSSAYNQGVTAIYKEVAKALKDDAGRILAFWLADTSCLFPATDFRHRYLLRLLFENCGTQSEEARAYLDTLSDETLSAMGFTRYTRTGLQHYRIRVGMES
jgi:hypothetical protein